MRKLANGWFLPPPLLLVVVLALLLLFPPQAATRRANPTTSAPTLSSHVHRWLRVTRYLPLWTIPHARGEAPLGRRCYPAPRIRCDDERRGLLGRKAHEQAAFRAELVRLGLLEDPVRAVALRGVEDAALAEPERDVGRLELVAVGDEVARPQL